MRGRDRQSKERYQSSSPQSRSDLPRDSRCWWKKKKIQDFSAVYYGSMPTPSARTSGLKHIFSLTEGSSQSGDNCITRSELTGLVIFVFMSDAIRLSVKYWQSHDRVEEKKLRGFDTMLF